ncbi:hypothetical protein C9374_002866 [Naegleria lovaniensis]|uniref:Uncharacterized protein n=1 Tax=Naegleria lovaniensis TaxID=51637 RepID=A0AA88GP92_NAELO|nr:uncharacterized protein C9374_002866 [Naegleria lovaniensis]KAG2386420.1 hypothetical protein C9374_002866 [Naegleria lovaniensis]
MGSSVSMATSTRIPAMNDSIPINNLGAMTHSRLNSRRLKASSEISDDATTHSPKFPLKRSPLSDSSNDIQRTEKPTINVIEKKSLIPSSHANVMFTPPKKQQSPLPDSSSSLLTRAIISGIEDEHDITRVDLECAQPVAEISSRRRSSQYSTSTRPESLNSRYEWTNSNSTSSTFLSTDSISNSSSLISLTGSNDHSLEEEDSTEDADETNSEEEFDSYQPKSSVSFSSLKKMLSKDLYPSHTSRFSAPSKVIQASRDELFPHDPSLSATPPKSHHLNIGNNKCCGHFGNCEYRIIITPPPYSPSSNASILNISSKTIEEERNEKKKIILEKRRKLYYIQSLRKSPLMVSSSRILSKE